ncbi:MAG: hypothetical protein NTZ78_09795 [Candidatus Aureabacteria bacterium]|nr:hypothetical protein [Candidatus Auribacterota bacterium]
MKRKEWSAIAVIFALCLIPPYVIALSSTPALSPPEYTDSEAVVLALETSGALLPPPDLYEQIHTDLIAIRQAYPEMDEVRHFPEWKPGELVAQLTPEAMEQFKKDEYHGMDSLNAEYGPVQMSVLSRDSLLLGFPLPYNPGRIAALYSTADGVREATPNWTIGDGSHISVELPRYTFTSAWGDCPSGCIYKHYWLFSVTDGSVALIQEWGDRLVAVTPTPTPTSAATPLLSIIVNKSSLRKNESLIVDVVVQPVDRSFTAYGGIMLGDVFYSFTLGNYSELQKGIHPLVSNVPGLTAAYAARLFSIQSIPSDIIPSGNSELRCSIIVGLVASQVAPTRVESCIPGYVDRKEITISK